KLGGPLNQLFFPTGWLLLTTCQSPGGSEGVLLTPPAKKPPGSSKFWASVTVAKAWPVKANSVMAQAPAIVITRKLRIPRFPSHDFMLLSDEVPPHPAPTSRQGRKPTDGW